MIVIARMAFCGFFLQLVFLSNIVASGTEADSKTILLRTMQDYIKVSGKVTSSDGKEGIPGVNIVIKGTTLGTVTDPDGNYTIEVPSGESILVFSSIGYIPREIIVENQTSIDISLVSDLKALDEVVVVGYGSQLKKDITGAVQTVDFEELAEMPVAQVTQKLQGQLAGVQINQYTGMPGGGMKVRIRGQASISTSSDPLFVVDGFAIDGDINYINPNEIETISVLKDASATALYGSRAANGVVMITTKKAKKGTTIGVSAYYGVQTVPQKGRPDMMNGAEFAQFKKESYEDLGEPVPLEFQNPSEYGEGTDWYEILLRKAAIQDYSVTVANGGEKHNVSVVAGYFNQEGVMLNSGYKRYSIRANTDFTLAKWLKTGLNVAPSFATRNELDSDGRFYSSGGRMLYSSMLNWPIVPAINEDGSIPASAYIDGVSSFKSPNWYHTIQHVTNETKTVRMLMNAFLEVKIIEDLKFKSTINSDYGQDKLDFYTPSYVSHSWSKSPPQTAVSQIKNDQYLNWLNENVLTYMKQFGQHNIDVIAGFTAQKYRLEGSTIDGSNFADDAAHGIGSAVNIDADSRVEEWTMLSYLGRINYNFSGKYLLTGSIRRDGSSRFGSDNRWGNFPSVSAGWILSNEPFMTNTGPLSFLKIKASFGKTGNNNIGNYRHRPTLDNTLNAIWGISDQSAAALDNMGNTELGWETTKQVNAGFDLGLFEGRIQFAYDYYAKVTSDMLYELQIPRASGFESIWSNIGKVKFWGHEFMLTTKNIVGEFKWNTNFNIAFSDNEVLELSALSDRIYGRAATTEGLGSTITQVGGRIGQIYGMVWDGVYDDQTEYDNSPKHTKSEVGTIKYFDVNGNGVIDHGGEDDDRKVIGNPFPKFIYGFTNTFSYKGVDLSILIDGAYGHDIVRMTDQGTTNLDGVFNVLTDVKDRWRSPENPGAGKYGKTTSATDMNRDWLSTLMVHDASYLAVRNINVGYTVPINAKDIRSMRVYISLQNAFMFTKYSGANPEVTTQDNGDQANDTNQGFDFASYPVPRTFSVGINMNF